MESGQELSFGKWRRLFWPIKSFELKKMLPLFLLKFFISFNYSLLSSIKDTQVVTAVGGGAEAISVLKGWVVLPAAFLAALLYTKLSNIFKKSTLFYGTISFFLLTSFVYAFVLYPNLDTYSPHQSADWLLSKLGSKHGHWVAVYRNWIPSFFFVLAELWSSVVIFFLFWGFANHITTVEEAKRSYNLSIAAGDIATIFAGSLTFYLIKRATTFDATLQVILSFVMLFSLIIMGIYWWMNRFVLAEKRFFDSQAMGVSIEEKTKLTLFQGIKYIFRSKYLISLATLVVGCALVMNLIEITWKANLKIQYPNPMEYQAFMSSVMTCVGFFALITAIFFGGTSVRSFGWRFSAQITPLAIGITGFLFLFLHLFQKQLTPLTAFFHTTPLLLIVLFGAVQSVLSKVVKYSFFDTTKEMAYIPLDHESKVKGKAAIDVVGSRLGKSGSSWIQIALLGASSSGSVLDITTTLIPVLLFVFVGWMGAIRYIHKEFEKKTTKAPSLTLSS